MDSINVDCRVCGAVDSFSLFEQSLNRFDIASSVYICRTCSVLYNPVLDLQKSDKADFELEQREAVQRNYIIEEDIELVRQQIIGKTPIITFLLNNFPNLRKKVLVDIGTGTGQLAIAAANYFDKVYATDLDISQVEKIVERFNKGNITVIDAYENIREEIDVAVLWHTMEHLFNPGQLLKDVKSRLSKSGMIYCQIPLYRKFAFEDSHVWFYNARTIECIKQVYGFSAHYVYFDQANNFMGFILVN